MFDSRVASWRHSISCWIVRASSPITPLVAPACTWGSTTVSYRVEAIRGVFHRRAHRGVERVGNGFNLVHSAHAVGHGFVERLQVRLQVPSQCEATCASVL
jgi:hypothetical protein